MCLAGVLASDVAVAETCLTRVPTSVAGVPASDVAVTETCLARVPTSEA